MRPLAFSLSTTLLLSLSTFAQQQAPTIVWQKCLGGSLDDKAYAIVRAHNGGFIVAGSSKSNDGDVSGHHGSTDSTDAWLVQLDTSGNIQWQKSLGGSGNDEFDRIIPTSDGGYLAAGPTESNNGDVSGNHGYSDIWVVKLDGSGAIQWQRCLGGSSNEGFYSIRLTSDGGSILTGLANSTDGDLASLAQKTPFWVIKLDQNGNIQWQHCYSSNGGDAYDIMPLAAGGYLIAADGQSAYGDFASAGGSGNPPLAFLLKIDNVGNVLQSKYYGNRTWSYALKNINDAEFLYYTNNLSCYPNNPNTGYGLGKYDTANLDLIGSGDAGSFCNIAPLAVNDGILLGDQNGLSLLSDGTGIFAGSSSYNDNNPGNHHGNPSDNLIDDGYMHNFFPHTWDRYYGGTGDDRFSEMVAQNDYTYFVAGYTRSNDGDVSGNHGGYDCWLVKMGNTNIIRGNVFLDYNSNGVRDGAEPLVNSILVQSKQGVSIFGSSTYNGVYRNSVDTGVYTTSVLSNVAYYTPVPASAPSAFHSYNNVDSISFALQPIPGKRDYQVNLYPISFPRPGRDATYKLAYANVGTDTLVNRKVQVVLDPRTSFLSASITPTTIAGDTLSWTISSLYPRDTASIMVDLQLAAPPVLNMLDTLLFNSYIDSTGDLNTADNTSVLRQVGIGSFDPNDKEEVNGGIVTADDLGKGKALLYTIRFQNTGNDTAFRVILRDTLGSKVDPSTLQMVGASHPYQLNIRNGNILEWRFENILLPDSNKNEPASHGDVTYRIKAAAGVATGDTIRNNASIYFDLNEPVATNTQLTVVTKAVAVLLPPPAPVISGLQAHYCPTAGALRIKITNIPASSFQATVIVKVDGNIATVGSDSSFTVRPDTLSTGQHIVMVVFRNTTAADTSSWSFNVDAAVTPQVDLNSNITTVTDLSLQVVLTATNVAGGGITPLYTFSKDRSFGTSVQAESASATYSFDPSALPVGNNSFYVRMRTSEACYTAPTAVDSIVIVRSTVTGIVDVDYPEQVINIYSNPFAGHLHITGLQSFKNYTLTLVRSNGQVVLRQHVSGRQEVNVETGVVAAGVYLLNIYDVKKGRLIGTAKLLSLGK